MAELGWREAIIEVLKANGAMHYTDITDEIAEKGLYKTDVATPANTVNALITKSIKFDGVKSPFVRLSRGMYALREFGTGAVVPAVEQPEAEETGLINAFGMYWLRSKVAWKREPRIIGQQQLGSVEVNFCGQRGVYLLHDGRHVVYVGRSTDQPLGVRLNQHVSDRLNGRWDRFSWFGVHPVSDSGAIESGDTPLYNLEMLIATMEALLIEGLEPPQNRKRGEDFRAVEFIQVEDPSIRRERLRQLMDEMRDKMN